MLVSRSPALVLPRRRLVEPHQCHRQTRLLPSPSLLSQVMSAGAIPVFVGRDMVRPFTEQIDWPSFSFLFTPDEVNTLMVKTLRAVTPDRLAEMQVRLEVEGYAPQRIEKMLSSKQQKRMFDIV